MPTFAKYVAPIFPLWRQYSHDNAPFIKHIALDRFIILQYEMQPILVRTSLRVEGCGKLSVPLRPDQ